MYRNSLYSRQDFATLPLFLEYLKKKEIETSYHTFYHPDEKQYLDAIYCIVLPERKNYIMNVLKKNKVPNVIFVNACTVDDLSVFEYRTLSSTFTLSSGIYGRLTKLPVHISYLSCMKHAMDNKFETILILEDDVFFQKPFPVINQYVKEFLMHDHLDILYLGYCFLDCKTKFTQLSENILSLPEKTYIVCKHAMVHRTRYFDDFLKNHTVLHKNSDLYFLEYFKKNCIKRAFLKDSVIFQNREKIESRNGNNAKYLKVCKF
jgi:hypothetical protein